ncbi:MAG: ABC transporter substrate-binding protein [Acidocella sp.]|nr:ABC transporter substrate-binding protein [Acidocella sp.]
MGIKISAKTVIRVGTGLFFGVALVTATTVPARAQSLPPDVVASKTLTFCSAVNLPPMEFFSPAQKPEGVDIELGDALAAKLGLHATFLNIPFAGLIPALLAGHCDAILSQLFIKPPRLKVIDEIPYMYSQEGFILKAGAPKLSGPEALSGEKAATVTGTTATDLLKKANVALAAAGKPPVTIVMFPENTPALQQVQFGQVAAYGVAYETALYYANLQPSQFEVGGPPYFKILTGIGVAKTTPGLKLALTTALHKLMADGQYSAIYKKWNLTDDMLKTP